jgi:tetratricopeptide (TPR) repeat protein
MADYYQILGIDRSADSTQVRTAYKRLAFLYHPDINPGNPAAEEMFKAINEAYHVLSDPLKKSRYDARLYSYSTYSDGVDEYWQAVQRQRYRQWHAQQQSSSRYKFDREYFRIQGLAFLTFIIIAGFCFGIVHTVNYIYALRQAELDIQHTQMVMQVNNLFNSGQIDEAFTMIKRLKDENPLEYKFYFAHDSLVRAIRIQAEQEFEANHFPESLHFLEILQQQESPPRLETLKKLAICEYHTGDYMKALQSLKQIYALQPWNLEILYQIGIINLIDLRDPEEALEYFTLGKKIFKDNMTRIYGAAFEIVMNPANTPGIYYEIFEARARTNLELKNYGEAEKDGNWAIFLRAEKPNGYKLRAIAKINQGVGRGLCNDIAMAKKLGAEGMQELERRHCRN